ncbi:MAG: sensor histidine kinase [Hyphomicrobiaceae bacterium]
MTLPWVSSLRLRLLLAGTVAILSAVTLSAFGLTFLFRQHVDSWIDKQLDTHIVQLIAGLGPGADGQVTVGAQPADPRFQQPFSGLYWEVSLEGGGRILRSRSLWDQEIRLPPPADSDSGLQHYMLAGPRGEALYTLQRRVILPERLGGQVARVAVAIDDQEVRRAVWDFATVLVPFLLVIGGLLVLAAWIQVRVGLGPLEGIQTRLTAIRQGRSPRMGAGWPREIQPLVGEIDTLLEAHEKRVAMAQARAADLAHGLKTPLQVIRAEASRLADRGESEAAATLEELVAVMTRHVERQMVRARLGGGSGNRSADLATSVDQVVRIMQHSPRGAEIDWQVDIPAGMSVHIDPDDLVEALGNLVENASRHARRRIDISARRDAERVLVRVADDGPGLPAESLQDVRRRGVRLDASASGAGLGLAIVQDIADAWNGELVLESSDAGLVATLGLGRASRNLTGSNP